MIRGDDIPAAASEIADDEVTVPDAVLANLLLDKLRPPRPRAGLVERAGPLANLDASGGGTVAVVQAPAGWGKTSLLASWAAAAPCRCAWFSIEETDNDPWRYWAHVVAAISLVAPGAAHAPTRLLRAPGADLATEVVPSLLNALATSTEPLALVLDDYHLVEHPDIHATMTLLVQHVPETCRVVIGTRSDPPLPLARLRAAGRVVDLGSDHLRFEEAEARVLLAQELAADLPHAAVRVLVDRTEGWAAALHLAALSLRGRSDMAAAIEHFDGQERHIVDYLVSEVLDRQPADVLQFLRRTAVLDRFDAGLCDAVTGTPGSAAMLDRIERDQLFLIRLDVPGRWYRYHHLFRELVARELHQREPRIVPTLHHRAASWLAAEGHHAEAIVHAVESGDTDLVVDLLAEHHITLMNEGHFSALERWFTQAVPEGRVRADGRLALARSILLSSTGRLEDAEQWLDVTSAAAPVHGPLAGDFPSVEAAVLLLPLSWRTTAATSARRCGGAGSARPAGRRGPRRRVPS